MSTGGSSYVAMASDHIVLRPSGPSSAAQSTPFINSSISIIGTQDGTNVTVVATARTLAGTTGSVAAIARGATAHFTLNSYDVLTLATDNPTDTSAARNLLCGYNQFDQNNDPSTCAAFPTFCDFTCNVDNADLTGSVVTSDKPVALFGGSACTLYGPADPACDHVEEQVFPFSTWGQDFVAVRTHPLRLTSPANTFASAANAGPDYYKIVAGCPATDCPTGTAITLSTAPAAGDVLTPGHCLSGSLTANTCKLAGGTFVEFRSKTSFTIHSTAPIGVGQFFAGENATVATQTNPVVGGDPSFVMLPPVQQWRSSYTILTAVGIADNYLGVAIDTSRVAAVQVDGAAVTVNTGVTGSANFAVGNVVITNGTHIVTVIPKSPQPPLPDGGVNNSLPGAGLTVYGFDSFVSYGYHGRPRSPGDRHGHQPRRVIELSGAVPNGDAVPVVPTAEPRRLARL